jgi:hypothetical protein
VVNIRVLGQQKCDNIEIPAMAEMDNLERTVERRSAASWCL